MRVPSSEDERPMTPDRPLISFVIPVRNGARHLPRLLASIVRTAGEARVPFEIEPRPRVAVVAE